MSIRPDQPNAELDMRTQPQVNKQKYRNVMLDAGSKEQTSLNKPEWILSGDEGTNIYKPLIELAHGMAKVSAASAEERQSFEP